MSKSNGGIIIDLWDKVQDMYLDDGLLGGPEDTIAKGGFFPSNFRT